MVLYSHAPLSISSRNERQKSRTKSVENLIKTTHQRVAGTGHTSENIAHPSFRDILGRGLPIALRGDKLNIDALIPGKSIGVELGKGAIATLFIEKKNPIHPQELTTKVDHNSYFIRKNDPTHTLLNTRKYWRDGMDTKNCVFLSLNSIVDEKTDGTTTLNAVRRKFTQSMNMIMLMGALSHCAPERETTTEQSDENITDIAYYEPQSRSITGEYIVENGDTLWKICRKYGGAFNPEDLQKANGLHSDKIRLGQKLRIPSFSQGGGYIPNVPRAIPVSRTHINQHSQDLGKWRNIVQIGDTTPESFMEAAMMYNNYTYKVGGTGSTPNAGIDSSQLIVNSLVGSGCLPEGTDTTVNGFKSMSQRIGNTEGKPGDFLIMGGRVPHIAIITQNLGNGNYTTYDASPKQKRVCENRRSAGKSYAVYQNPFMRGNGGIKAHSDEVEASDAPVLADRKKIAEAGIQESYLKKVTDASEIIIENQEKYEAVEKKTGVPWQAIAVLHFREASCDFSKGLHNGQRWDQKTTIVPVDKGPFESWEDAAVDAIKTHEPSCPVTQITLENDVLSKIAKWGETFNGLGYRKKKGGNPYTDSGLVSPEGIPFYSTGLYVKDGVYNAKKVDRRPGIMAILLHLLQGENTPTYTVSPEFIHKTPEKQKIAEPGSLSILTDIRSAPVASRKEFLRQHGAEFGIPFADGYKGSVDQNKTLTALIKNNTSFREKWTEFFTGQKSRQDSMVAN